MKRIVVVVLTALALVAQPAAFEVASIHPSGQESPGSTVIFQHDRFLATDATLKALIQLAYGVQEYQIGGITGWMNSISYDVDARQPSLPSPVSSTQWQNMIQALLADRFQLKVHRETRELQVSSLTVDKTGSKLTTGPHIPIGYGNGRIRGTMSMSRLASILETRLHRPVADDTDLSGEFNVEITWMPDQKSTGEDDSNASEPSMPSISTALQEQAGLKLGAKKGLVQIIVVESANKPSEN